MSIKDGPVSQPDGYAGGTYWSEPKEAQEANAATPEPEATAVGGNSLPRTATGYQIGYMREVSEVHGYQVNDWISVKDRMPDMEGYQDGSTERVYVYLKRDYAPCTAIASGEYTEDGFIWHFDYSHMLDGSEVTHWQTLPDPPRNS